MSFSYLCTKFYYKRDVIFREFNLDCLWRSVLIIGLSSFGPRLLLHYCGHPRGCAGFKLAGLALCPFGRDIEPRGGSLGAGSIVLNVIWIICGGLEMAVAHFFLGIMFCITILGIPFGMQHFKLALLALLPFGNEVR